MAVGIMDASCSGLEANLCIAKRCLGHCWQMALWLGMCGWLPGFILDPWINFIGFFVFQAVQRSS